MIHSAVRRLTRWIHFKNIYEGPVYNRYEPFPNPYATAFGRIHLALHVLFYIPSMVLVYAVYGRVNSIANLDRDLDQYQDPGYLIAFGFLTLRFVLSTWTLVAMDHLLSTGNYGVCLC